MKNSRLIIGAALALASLADSRIQTLPYAFQKEPGTPLGGEGKSEFTDSKGRKYTRDEKGTIRKAK